MVEIFEGKSTDIEIHQLLQIIKFGFHAFELFHHKLHLVVQEEVRPNFLDVLFSRLFLFGAS